MRSRQVLTLAVSAAVVLVSCSKPAGVGTTTGLGLAAQASSTPAQSQLRQPPAAYLPDGTQITLELAVSPEEHERGLMYRPHLAPNHGMLFLFDKPMIPGFWMKNTWIPLDMVFVDKGGVVVDVAKDVQPCRADPCPQYRPRSACAAVLEVAAGTATTHGVSRGVHLRFTGVEELARTPADGAPQADQ